MNVTYHLRDGRVATFHRHYTDNIGVTVQAVADQQRGEITFTGPEGVFVFEPVDITRIEIDF